MISRFLSFSLFLIVLVSYFAYASNQTSEMPTGASGLWYQQFTPLRQFFVSPLGNGSGLKENDPMSLYRAILFAKPGDLFWLLSGKYSGAFVLTNPGTASHPVVYRAFPGNHALVVGGFQIKAAYNWIWGLEITDPQKSANFDAGVSISAPGARIINNVIHDHLDKNGIGAWNEGTGQVIYGNTIYANGKGPHHPHNLYVQNDFRVHGYKYIINNILMDSADVCADCFNVHGYTKEGQVSGLFLENNTIKNGRFLIGGYGMPADREIVRKNNFYNCLVQFGYRRPFQVDFEDNYLARSGLSVGFFWGEGETQFSQSAPNVFTGNQIILPSELHIAFATSAYLSTGRCEGCPMIRKNDVFNQNQYSEPFHASFFAGGKNLGPIGFNEWKSATASAGNGFDTDSSVIPAPKQNKVVVIPNAYDPTRLHIIVFNWEKSGTQNLSLSPLMKVGSTFKIYNAKQPFTEPIIAGTYSGSISIPLNAQEFSAFLLIAQPAS
jgi:hypothetical protein